MNWIEGKKCDAAAAAEMIQDGDILGVSGFTLAGYPKAVPLALAARAEPATAAMALSHARALSSSACLTRATRASARE